MLIHYLQVWKMIPYDDDPFPPIDWEWNKLAFLSGGPRKHLSDVV